MARLATLLHVLSCLLLASALDIRGKVAWNTLCPDYKSLGQARAVIDEGAIYGTVARDGSFVVPDVPEGLHILTISSHDYVFDSARIQVNNSWPVPEARPYVPGTPLNPPSTVLLAYPLTFPAREKHNYFVAPEAFSIIGMLSNPMMLMMVVGGVMVLGMPYLVKNMDPDMLEDFKEQQAKVSSLQSALQSGDIGSRFALSWTPNKRVNDAETGCYARVSLSGIMSAGSPSTDDAPKPSKDKATKKRGKK